MSNKIQTTITEETIPLNAMKLGRWKAKTFQGKITARDNVMWIYQGRIGDIYLYTK